MTDGNKMRPTGENGDRHKIMTRRDLLAASAAGIAAFAGCQTDGEDGADGETGANGTDGETGANGTDGETEVHDSSLISNTQTVPTDTQYNSFNARTYAGSQGGILFEKLAFYSPDENDFIPLLASDWSVDGTTMQVTIDDAYTWHNGDPLTAPDVATKLKLNRYTGTRIADFVDAVRAPDDSTVELDLTGQLNESVLAIAVLDTRIETKRDIGNYEDYVTRLDDATSDDERDTVLSELVEWVREDPVGTGPFEFADRNQQRATLTRYPDHPAADETNYERYEFLHATGNQGQWEALIGKEQDASPYINLPANILEQMPHIEDLRRPIGATRAMLFQHNHDLFSDRRVRQAFAYAIDLGPAGKNGYGHVNVPLDGPPVGFHPSVLDQWIDDVSQYVSYGQDQDRATTLLKAAGLSRENNQWLDPDGNSLEVNIPVPAGEADTVGIFQTLADQLQQFGIQSNIETFEGTAFYGQVIPEGDFELAGGPWAFTQNPHPYFWFESIFNQHASAINYPETVEIPPVGEPDSEPESVDIGGLMDRLATAQSEDEEVQAVRELAWVVNYDLPILPAAARNAQAAMNVEKFSVPSEDEPVMNIPSPVHVLPHLGQIKFNPENGR